MSGGNGPKVIVVGTGFGCRIQIPALRAAGFDVVGLVGANLERTRERALSNKVPAGFDSVSAAVAATGATAAAISVPPHMHKAVTLEAIAAGCHVICEKPFALDSAEAREMLEAAEKAGITHAIGNEFRWDPARATIGQALSEGAIGTPRIATFTHFMHYSSNPYVELPEWWFDPARGGGWLGAYGSHVTDWVRTWLGELDTLSASLNSVTGPAGGAEDTFVVRFRSRAGLDGTLQNSSGVIGPMAAMALVGGSEGTVWLDPAGAPMLADAQGSRALAIPAECELPPLPEPSSDPRQQTPEWQMLTPAELPPYLRLCEAWRAQIEGKPAPGPVPMPTFADGLASMQILDAIRASARAGGAVVRVDDF